MRDIGSVFDIDAISSRTKPIAASACWMRNSRPKMVENQCGSSDIIQSTDGEGRGDARSSSRPGPLSSRNLRSEPGS